MSSELEIPVAFLIYKRPDVMRRVFATIAAARPRRLYVIADGPRDESEAARCAEARAIIAGVDWDCEVFTNYAETNLGLKRRVSSGLDWVFAHEEQAIILEDDCLPDSTFFRFCAELLERYRDDERIMHISGNNFLRGRVPIATSYYFSRYPHVWGWATWRRAWRQYDVDMIRWKDHDRERYLGEFEKRIERDFWRFRWRRVAAGKEDTWSSQWVFACLASGGYAITPAQNLVSNIGAGSDATNTHRRRLIHGMNTESLDFPLNHPAHIARHKAADEISVRDAILNPPSGNTLLDWARSIAKHIRWAIGR